MVLFDLTVKVVKLPAPTFWFPPGETCRSDGLLEVPVIEMAVFALWLIWIMAEESRFIMTTPGSAVMVQVKAGDGEACGDGFGAGVGDGDGEGLGVGFEAGVVFFIVIPPPPRIGLGDGTTSP